MCVCITYQDKWCILYINICTLEGRILLKDAKERERGRKGRNIGKCGVGELKKKRK